MQLDTVEQPSCPPREQWEALLAEQISEEDCKTLEAHLSECAACQAVLDQVANGTNQWAELESLVRECGPRPDETVGGHAEWTITEDWQIPGYDILEKIGQGGMGEVYLARELRLNRIVALKVFPFGDPERITRFQMEAETAALLKHPNIVQVYQAGSFQGRFYISLEYVEGGDLAQRLHGRPLSPGETVDLMITLAYTVQVAHDVGILHRDLKPANILISGPSSGESTPKSGTSGSIAPVPKITDFGLARPITASDGPTRSGEVIGTPSYMPPEQARAEAGWATVRVDVYSLGAILYECLTGRPPFRSNSPLETLKQVNSEAPVPPTHCNKQVPRDLETICLKCLEKNADKRYDSARALAEDLERFRNNRSITARPVSSLERTYRWCRRNPVVATLLLLVAVSVCAFVSACFVMVREANDRATTEADLRKKADNNKNQAIRQTNLARKNERFAKREKLKVSQYLYQAHMLLAQVAWREDDLPRLQQLLNHQQPANTGGVDMRGFEWHYWWQQAHVKNRQHNFATRIHEVFWTADQVLVPIPSQGKVVRWDPATDTVRDILTGMGPSANSFCCTADGRYLADFDRQKKQVEIRDLQTGQVVFSRPHKSVLVRLAFSPDGTHLAMAAGIFQPKPAEIQVWDWPKRKLVNTIAVDRKGVHCLKFSPDGQSLAAGLGSQKLQVWDWGNKKLRFQSQRVIDGIFQLQYSPDGRYLSTVDLGERLSLWETDTGNRFWSIAEQANGVVFSPDSRYIVYRTGTGFCKVRDIETQELIHRQAIPAVQGITLEKATPSVLRFNARGTSLVSSSPQGIVRILKRQDILPFTADLLSVSEDGTTIAELITEVDPKSGNSMQVVQLVDRQSGKVLRQKSLSVASAGRITGLTLFPDKTRLAVTLNKKQGQSAFHVEVRNMQTGEVEFAKDCTGPCRGLLIDPTGRYLSYKDNSSRLTVWALSSGNVIYTLPACRNVRFSPNGQHLAVVQRQQGVGKRNYHHAILVRNLKVGKTRFEQKSVQTNHDSGNCELLFSPDGTQLASLVDIRRETKLLGKPATVSTGHIRIRDMGTGNELFSANDGHFAGGNSSARFLAFDRKGSSFAHVQTDGTLRLIDRKHKSDPVTLANSRNVHCLTFSPDGKRLAVLSKDRQLQLWNLTTLQPILTLNTLPGYFPNRMWFARNGRSLVVTSFTPERQCVQFWDSGS